MSAQVLQKVDEIIKACELPDRHSYFQLEKFVVGREPTGHAQLWAIARELQAKREAVDGHEKDLADAEDNLEIFDLRVERTSRELRRLAQSDEPNADLNIREAELNIRKLLREKEALVRSARKAKRRLAHLLEEMEHLAGCYDTVAAQTGGPKPFDDADAQKEMWGEKLLEEFNLRVLLQKPIDPDFVRHVMCLPDDTPVKRHVVSLIEGIQKARLADRRPRPAVEVKPKVIGQ